MHAGSAVERGAAGGPRLRELAVSIAPLSAPVVSPCSGQGATRVVSAAQRLASGAAARGACQRRPGAWPAAAPPRPAMFSLLYGLYEYLFRKTEVRLLLLGLDRAGKTSCLERLKALHAPPDAPPAPHAPILPTVGLNIGRIEAGGAAVVLWDLGGAATLRSIWDKYFAEAHALIYVVDAAAGERLEESRAALEQALASRELEGAPLLLLANKSDIAGHDGCAAVTAAFAGLTAERGERPVRVVECCALSGDGLRAGLAWALDAARHSRRSRLLDAAAANA